MVADRTTFMSTMQYTNNFRRASWIRRMPIRRWLRRRDASRSDLRSAERVFESLLQNKRNVAVWNTSKHNGKGDQESQHYIHLPQNCRFPEGCDKHQFECRTSNEVLSIGSLCTFSITISKASPETWVCTLIQILAWKRFKYVSVICASIAMSTSFGEQDIQRARNTIEQSVWCPRHYRPRLKRHLISIHT